MTSLRIKEKPPLGYRRSFVLSRSEKTFVVGILILCIGLLNGTTTLIAISKSYELISVRSAQSSPFYMLMHALNSSFYFRVSLASCALGLFVMLVGYLNRRDENYGNILLPPRYVKKK